jgi:hypothetical protein
MNHSNKTVIATSAVTPVHSCPLCPVLELEVDFQAGAIFKETILPVREIILPVRQVISSSRNGCRFYYERLNRMTSPEASELLVNMDDAILDGYLAQYPPTPVQINFWVENDRSCYVACNFVSEDEAYFESKDHLQGFIMPSRPSILSLSAIGDVRG